MHVFTGTDTRIIDMDGTIIIVQGVKSKPDVYRVMIDGIFCGFLESVHDVLIPTPGSKIKSIYIDRISRLKNTGSTNVQASA